MHKEASPIDAGRYERAVREAVNMWTPLLGVHLPPHARKLLLSNSIDGNISGIKNANKLHSTNTSIMSSDTKIIPSTSQRKMNSRFDSPAQAPTIVENSVLVTKKILKELNMMEKSGNDNVKASLRGFVSI